MKDKKYIIFDLDGTLVDSFPTVVNACKRVVEGYASVTIPSNEFFDNYHSKDMEQMFVELSKLLNISAEEFRKRYDAQYALDSLTSTTVISQQYLILNDAKARGIGIIVLTNKKQELAETVCRTILGDNAIDAIIGRKDTQPIKPRHVLIERFRELGINPKKQCLMYYGDSQSDYETAKLLNIEYNNTKII